MKDYNEYYAIALESSYYVKKGTVQPLKNEAEALKAKETGVCEFGYADNMHWDTDKLKCKVIVKEIHYKEL